MRVLINQTEQGFMFRAGVGMHEEFVLQPIKNLRGVSDRRSLVLAIVDDSQPGTPAHNMAENYLHENYLKVVSPDELTGVPQAHVAVLTQKPDGKGGHVPGYRLFSQVTGGNGVMTPAVIERYFGEKKPKPATQPINETRPATEPAKPEDTANDGATSQQPQQQPQSSQQQSQQQRAGRR